MKTELCVFDLAGTTVYDDDYVALALIEALKSKDILVDVAEVNEFMGIPKPLAIKYLLRKKTGLEIPENSSVVLKLHQLFLDNMIDFYKNSDFVKEIEGVTETFEYLKEKGILLSIDTGFSSDITEIILQRMKWREMGLLNFWISSDQVSNGRPYPDMIFEIMKMANINDSTLVTKIGDTPSDVQQGIIAGCGNVIAVLSGAGTSKDFEANKPTHIINSVLEIKKQKIL